MSGDERKRFEEAVAEAREAVARALRDKDFWMGKFNDYEAKGDKEGMNRVMPALLKAQDAVAAAEGHRAALEEQRARRTSSDEMVAAAGPGVQDLVAAMQTLHVEDEKGLEVLHNALTAVHAWSIDGTSRFVGWPGLLDLSFLKDFSHVEDRLFGGEYPKAWKAYPRGMFCALWASMFNVATILWNKPRDFYRTYVLGAPGCGKSLLCFLFSLFLSKRQQRKIHYFRRVNDSIVIYYVMDGGALTYYGKVYWFSLGSIQSAEVNSRVGDDWSVCDGWTPDDRKVFEGRLVCSSTNLKISDEWYERSKVHYLQPWTLEELREAEKQSTFTGYPVKKDLESCYLCVGGSVRHIVRGLQHCRDWASMVVSDITVSKDKVSQYLDANGRDRVVRAFLCLNRGSQLRYDVRRLVIDSTYVLHHLEKSRPWSHYFEMLQVGRFLGGSLHGLALELCLHKYVEQYQHIHLKVSEPMNSNDIIFDKLQYFRIDKSQAVSNQKDHVLSVLPRLSERTYWCPELAIFPTIDCGFCIDGVVWLMQATVAKDHSFDSDFAIKVKKAAARNSNKKAKFVFITGEQKFSMPTSSISQEARAAFDFFVAQPVFDKVPKEEKGSGSEALPVGKSFVFGHKYWTRLTERNRILWDGEGE